MTHEGQRGCTVARGTDVFGPRGIEGNLASIGSDSRNLRTPMRRDGLLQLEEAQCVKALMSAFDAKRTCRPGGKLALANRLEALN